jgi:hypothetical protein
LVVSIRNTSKKKKSTGKFYVSTIHGTICVLFALGKVIEVKNQFKIFGQKNVIKPKI